MNLGYFEYYLIVINVVTLIVFGIDKINAIRHKSRIRNVTLLGLAFIGGSIGGLPPRIAFEELQKFFENLCE